MTALQPNDVQCLRHMLGTTPPAKYKTWGFRNYFCAGKSGSDYESLVRLEQAGLVVRGEERTDSVHFHATPLGMDIVGVPRKAPAREEQR